MKVVMYLTATTQNVLEANKEATKTPGNNTPSSASFSLDMLLEETRQ